VPVRDEHHRDQHAEKAAVKRHAALPDRENLERVGKVVAGLVKEHVAETPAENHPDDRAEQQVVELLASDRREARLDAPHAEPPRGRKTGEVHQPVPADRKRAERKRDRIEIRMDEHGKIRF
jgi:hypothetical protein